MKENAVDKPSNLESQSNSTLIWMAHNINYNLVQHRHCTKWSTLEVIRRSQSGHVNYKGRWVCEVE